MKNSNEIDDLVREQLRKAISKSGMSQRQISKLAGLGDVTLNRLLNGGRQGMTNSTLAKLASVLNTPVGYFFGEIQAAPQPQTTAPDIKIYYGNDKPDEIDNQYVALPLFDTRVAATPDVIDIARDQIKGWVTYRNIHHYPVHSLHCFRVKGNSMDPDIKDGDYVIIQNNGYEPPERPDTNAVYLCQIDDGYGGYGLTLKKVQVAGDCLALISINREYPVRIIHMPDVDHQIIMGRLVRSWREW